jgi:hypothetical protein
MPGAERIEPFDLDVEIDVRRREPVDLDDGCVADGSEDVREFCHWICSADAVEVG